MFARFVRPLLSTILYGKFGRTHTCINVPVSRISLLGEKRRKDYPLPQKKRVIAPILKPTDDQKPETFFFFLPKGQKWNKLFNIPMQEFHEWHVHVR